MLIPRQHHSTGKISVKNFNNCGLEVKPIYKKMAQHNHINKLLSTAAAGNGVIGDVDALNAPTHDTRSANQQQQQHHNNSSSKERTERNLWRNDEVMEMLYVMQQVKALDKLNDKTVKSENVFKDVEVVMHKNGFMKKSHVQIWTKWKFLKSTYMTSRRNGVIPRMIPQEIYEVLHQMITSLNQGLSECGNSTTESMDGDNSNAGGMMVNGADGAMPNSTAANAEENDSFGMSHPIFGFRLGIVKNEPSDTGYDAVENNEPQSEIESLEKSPEKQAKKEKQNVAKENPVKKNVDVLVPHRGRGRPPKNPPAATSTPNNTPSPAARPTAQMPPLRVAPFAKAANTTNSLAASRPPPPLTMPPTPRPIRVTNLSNLSEPIKNGGSPRMPQPKLLPKPTPTQIQVPPQPIRLPKEISVQTTRTSLTPSPSYPKLKQVPMRKTPYSLRPDRSIPDLDESFSPPPTVPAEKTKRFEEVPSTSHLVMQSNIDDCQNGIPRKRRLDCQQINSGPTKFKRITSDDEEIPSTDPEPGTKGATNYGKHLQSVIVDLSTTLRSVQTQMMADFFNKQHELLQKEHEFQMQQDRLIMETFQMQTFEIMKSVRDLVGTIAVGRREEELRFLTSKMAKRRKLQNGYKQKRVFVNEESPELQLHHIQEHVAEASDQEESGQQQLEHEGEDFFSDEDEAQQQNTEQDLNSHDVEGEEAAEAFNNQHHPNEDHDEDVQSQLQQESQSLEHDDDDDDDDDDEDDDDDDDDDDSDSDDDDNEDDENANSQMVNGNDHASLQMVQAELMEEN